VVLKTGKKYVSAVFSAQCGGHTQDYGEAWGYHNAVVGVADFEPKYNQEMEFPLSPYRLENWIRQERVAYCRFYGLGGYQNYRWAALVSTQDVQKKQPSIGKLRRMVVTERSTAGWARRLLVEGDAGSKEIKGDAIRRFLGGVRSNLILIEPQFNLDGWPQEFIIYGGGWGHGVGLCQVGCHGMAKAGKTCGEILKHYFPKAKIKKLAADRR
jgi:stage II sporulation protein D